MKNNKVYVRLGCVLLYVAWVYGCSSGQDEAEPEKPAVESAERPVQQVSYPVHQLPQGIVWESNNDDPVFSSEKAEKGGTFRSFMLSFPLTLRTVGPDSNGSFRANLNGNQLSLTDLHPNTQRVIPGLATHWAYDSDGKTVYYKLDPDARWSSGVPVTADDYLFTMEFMQSKHIVAPWYNKQYSEEIVEVKKYDELTISITGARPKPKVDLHYYYGLGPTPRHFHKLDENWVTEYNWKVEPNTGPYRITTIKKGKYIEFTLKDDWWAKDRRYFKNRYNVKKVRSTVIRDMESAFRYFLKGELDAFPITIPNFWHEKINVPEFHKGYIHKLWFYNDTPQAAYGMFLNQELDIFKDINARYGFAHAMNLEKMIKSVLRGDYYRLHSIFTGYGDYSNSDIRTREFDLEKSDEYLTKAGWAERGPDGILVKEGKRFSVTVTYGAATQTDRLIFLKEEAKKAGIELNLELLDSASAFKKTMEKKHEVAWSAWAPQFRPQYWGMFHSDNAYKAQTTNITNTDDPELDELILQYREEVDGDKRAAYSREILAKIHESGMVVPTIMVPYSRYAYWRWLTLPQFYGTKWTDNPFEPFGGTGGLFWIDLEERKQTQAAKKSGKTYAPVTIIDDRYKVY